jgi:hypothetical protein
VCGQLHPHKLYITHSAEFLKHVFVNISSLLLVSSRFNLLPAVYVLGHLTKLPMDVAEAVELLDSLILI